MELWCKVLILILHSITMLTNILTTILVIKYLNHKQIGRQTSMDCLRKYFLVLQTVLGTILTLMPIGLIIHSFVELLVIQIIGSILDFVMKLFCLNLVIFIVFKHLCVSRGVISLRYENLAFCAVYSFALLGSVGLTLLEHIMNKPEWIKKVIIEENDLKVTDLSYSTLSLFAMTSILVIYHQICIELRNAKFQDRKGCLIIMLQFLKDLKNACSRQVQLNEEESRIQTEFRHRLLLYFCILSWSFSALLISKSFIPLALTMLEFMILTGVPLSHIFTSANLRAYSYRKIQSYFCV